MSDESNRYRIGVKEGVDVPYGVVLECETLNGFKNYIVADRQRAEIARRHGINPDFLEVKIRR